MKLIEELRRQQRRRRFAMRSNRRGPSDRRRARSAGEPCDAPRLKLKRCSVEAARRHGEAHWTASVQGSGRTVRPRDRCASVATTSVGPSEFEITGIELRGRIGDVLGFVQRGRGTPLSTSRRPCSSGGGKSSNGGIGRVICRAWSDCGERRYEEQLRGGLGRGF